jgi:hypothetical protein
MCSKLSRQPSPSWPFLPHFGCFRGLNPHCGVRIQVIIKAPWSAQPQVASRAPKLGSPCTTYHCTPTHCSKAHCASSFACIETGCIETGVRTAEYCSFLAHIGHLLEQSPPELKRKIVLVDVRACRLVEPVLQTLLHQLEVLCCIGARIVAVLLMCPMPHGLLALPVCNVRTVMLVNNIHTIIVLVVVLTYHSLGGLNFSYSPSFTLYFSFHTPACRSMLRRISASA